MLSCLFIAASWSPAGTLLAVLYVMFSCVFVPFTCGILGQVWYLIVLIPDICLLPYFSNLYNASSHRKILPLGISTRSNTNLAVELHRLAIDILKVFF